MYESRKRYKSSAYSVLAPTHNDLLQANLPTWHVHVPKTVDITLRNFALDGYFILNKNYGDV